MTGSSVLPVSIHKNKLYFLFGLENEFEDSAKGWSDFGGGVESGESIYKTALREGGEELTGFLGNEFQLEKHIKKHGGVFHLSYKDNYHVHLFHLEYDDKLPIYYNQNHEFLWKRMDKRYLSKTMLFEKINIKWFSIPEIKRKIKSFRPFYQDIIKMVIKNEKKIRTFLKKRSKTRKQKILKNKTLKK